MSFRAKRSEVEESCKSFLLATFVCTKVTKKKNIDDGSVSLRNRAITVYGIKGCRLFMVVL